MRKSEYPKRAKTLGQEIRKVRMDLRCSLSEVSRKVGVTESFLSRIEADKQLPSPPVFSNIAKILNLSWKTKRAYYKENLENAYKNDPEIFKTTKHEIYLSQYIPRIWDDKDLMPTARRIFLDIKPSFIPTEEEIKRIIPILKKLREITIQFENKSKAAEKEINHYIDSILQKHKITPPKGPPEK